MSLFDSKDVLIKEFQDVLGERLLQENYSLDQEVRPFFPFQSGRV